jgi:hypothetical protein
MVAVLAVGRVSALRQVPGLHDLIARYGLTTFVETGSDEGDGLRYAANLKLGPRYSCDINPVSAAVCSQWGIVANTTSTEFLRLLKRFIQNKPTLFWLDAHFPATWGIEPWHPNQFFPLLGELQILATMEGIQKCVIACDDICNVQSSDNPTRRSTAPSCTVEGITLTQLAETLDSTHTATIHDVDTGILIFTPK